MAAVTSGTDVPNRGTASAQDGFGLVSPASGRLLAVLTAIVAVMVFAVHYPALSANAQCFDDDTYLTDNPLVQNPSWESVRRLLTEVFRPTTVKGYYHPLGTLTIMFDYAMGGRPEDRRAFNRTALMLHVSNTVLIVLLMRLLFGQPWVAAMTGLLFGLHPLTVEPVVWLGQRKAILAGTLGTACLVLYVLWVRRRGWGWYLGSVVAYVLALLSKPTSMPLPVLMLLLAWFPLGRLNRRALVEKLPFYVVGGFFAIVTVLSHASTSVVAVGSGQGPLESLALACYKLIFYLAKICRPTNLSSCYSGPGTVSLANPAVLAGVVGTAILAAVVWMSVRWTRSVATGIGMFFLAILPTLGLVEYSWVFAFDNYVYLPAIGLLVLFAAVLRWGWGISGGGRHAAVRKGAIVAIVTLLAAAEARGTRAYLSYWRDTEALFRRMCFLSPDAYRARNNLALSLMQKGRLDEAVEQFRAALRANPQYELAHKNLADALVQKGRFDDAIRHYRESLRLEPRQEAVQYKLANVLHRQGDVDGAIACYVALLRLKPDSAVAHFNLGTLLMSRNRLDEAVFEFREAIRLKPDVAEMHNNLGAALFKQGKTDQAILHYTEALRLKPDFANARRNLDAAMQARHAGPS